VSRPNGDLSLVSRPNGDLSLVSRPNGDLSLVSRPNGDLSLVSRPNGDLSLVSRPNGDLSLVSSRFVLDCVIHKAVSSWTVLYIRSIVKSFLFVGHFYVYVVGRTIHEFKIPMKC